MGLSRILTMCLAGFFLAFIVMLAVVPTIMFKTSQRMLIAPLEYPCPVEPLKYYKYYEEEREFEIEGGKRQFPFFKANIMISATFISAFVVGLIAYMLTRRFTL